MDRWSVTYRLSGGMTDRSDAEGRAESWDGALRWLKEQARVRYPENVRDPHVNDVGAFSSAAMSFRHACTGGCRFVPVGKHVLEHANRKPVARAPRPPGRVDEGAVWGPGWHHHRPCW